MNREEFEKLKAATAGHTPGPWCIHRQAAAPALLAEVERLRGHIVFMREMVDADSDLACAMDAALDGEEIPNA